MSGQIKFPTEREVDISLYEKGTGGYQIAMYGSSSLIANSLYLVISTIVLALFATHIVPTRGALISGSVFGGLGVILAPITIYLGPYTYYKYRNIPMDASQLEKKLADERSKGNPYLLDKNRQHIKPDIDTVNKIASAFHLTI